MEAIGIDRILITGAINELKLLGLDMNAQVNEHAYLQVYGILPGFISNIDSLHEKTINLQIKLERKTEILFSGIIHHLETKYQGEVQYIKLEAYSGTCRFDYARKNRAFQNINQSYTDLAKKIAGDNKNIIVLKDNKNKLVFPFIQYKETDWELIKRIAGRLGTVIIPEITNTYPQAAIGMKEGGCYELCGVESCTKNYDRESFIKFRGKRRCVQKDFITYDIKCNENYDLGDKIIYDDHQWFILKKRVQLIRNVLEISYLLGTEEMVSLKRLNNPLLKGVSLAGEVSYTFGEKVKVKLDIGEADTYQASQVFSYYYSPLSKNFMYSMPEIGAKIELYFPDCYEEHAIVKNCIHEQVDYPDNEIKQFEISTGKRMVLSENTIEYSNKEKEGSIELVDRFGIIFLTHKNIQISALKSITIQGGTMTDIIAKDCIFLECAESNNSISMSGNELLIETENVVSSGLPRKINTLFEKSMKSAIQGPEKYALYLLGGLNQGELSEIQKVILSAIPVFNEPKADFNISDFFAISRYR